MGIVLVIPLCYDGFHHKKSSQSHFCLFGVRTTCLKFKIYSPQPPISLNLRSVERAQTSEQLCRRRISRSNFFEIMSFGVVKCSLFSYLGSLQSLVEEEFALL
ncbi:hypothetical protein HS088_TW02G00383 [Tripterygium wilfordii]|uniref:Uncharacterized protein n=1 Tax=Tripterygium wilfordii TaxID=458696 RepID=A0A7J7DYA6_TRIWF|nr:uncharacterized protein LOC119983406 [Tripterygium wilfordii]KAF5751370.1 hypothetical protein HS088_TW02G00383 [Tripterygium wilfordii]